jgi:hypothetical protein
VCPGQHVSMCVAMQRWHGHRTPPHATLSPPKPPPPRALADLIPAVASRRSKSLICHRHRAPPLLQHCRERASCGQPAPVDVQPGRRVGNHRATPEQLDNNSILSPHYSTELALVSSSASTMPLQTCHSSPSPAPPSPPRAPPKCCVAHWPKCRLHRLPVRPLTSELLRPTAVTVVSSLQCAPILLEPQNYSAAPSSCSSCRLRPTLAGGKPETVRAMASPVLRDGPQDRVWPAHES